MKKWWCVVVGLLCVVQQAGGQPAFPGAQGFGAHARGGRGGTVMEVTRLDDSGPGTLRQACEAAGPRTVVFRVGGAISVETPIIVRGPYLTIAGQTAPGDGILIRKAKSRVPLAPLCIRSHDVVVRGLRIRVGDSPDGTETDCLDISSEDDTDSVHDMYLQGNYHANLRTSETQEEVLVVEPQSRKNVVSGRFAVPPVRTTPWIVTSLSP